MTDTAPPDSAVVFLDTETTGLHPRRDQIWEIAAIARTPDRTETELHMFVEHDATLCAQLPDPFYSDHLTRFPASHGGIVWNPEVVPRGHAISKLNDLFKSVTDGKNKPHVVGAVPSFDTERLLTMQGDQGLGWQLPWHYHIIDVEILVAGYLRGQIAATYSTFDHGDAEQHVRTVTPPYDSEALSRLVGVEPDLFPRHTAMGDVHWAMAMYDAVTFGYRPNM